MTTPTKKRAGLVVGVALLLCLGISRSAWAWGHGFHHSGGFHGRFGVFIGAPLFWGPWDSYYYPPYYPSYYSPYYYPPVSQVYMEQPPVYVQRNDTAGGAPPPNYWYYCTNPQGYYPYVQNCSVSWMQVVPQAPQ